MELLQQAIAALYNSTCDVERRKADAWLQDFMHSDQAWYSDNFNMSCVNRWIGYIRNIMLNINIRLL